MEQKQQRYCIQMDFIMYYFYAFLIGLDLFCSTSRKDRGNTNNHMNGMTYNNNTIKQQRIGQR